MKGSAIPKASLFHQRCRVAGNNLEDEKLLRVSVHIVDAIANDVQGKLAIAVFDFLGLRRLSQDSHDDFFSHSSIACAFDGFVNNRQN